MHMRTHTASPSGQSDGGARALVAMGDARRRLAPPLLPDDQPTPPLGLALRTAALTGPQPSPAHRQPPGKVFIIENKNLSEVNDK